MFIARVGSSENGAPYYILAPNAPLSFSGSLTVFVHCIFLSSTSWPYHCIPFPVHNPYLLFVNSFWSMIIAFAILQLVDNLTDSKSTTWIALRRVVHTSNFPLLIYGTTYREQINYCLLGGKCGFPSVCLVVSDQNKWTMVHFLVPPTHQVWNRSNLSQA